MTSWPVSIMWWNPDPLHFISGYLQLSTAATCGWCMYFDSMPSSTESFLHLSYHTHASNHSHFINVVTTFREKLDDRIWTRTFIKPGHRTDTHFHQARSQNSALFIKPGHRTAVWPGHRTAPSAVVEKPSVIKRPLLSLYRFLIKMSIYEQYNIIMQYKCPE